MHGGSQYSHRNLAGSGWEVSAITTFATGHPFDISYQGGESYSLFCSNGDFYYTCPDVPNQVAPVRFANPHNTQAATRGQLFDGTTNQFQLGAANILGASFADEATGTFGNISRNQYFGPGDNTNMTVAQNISFSKDNPNRFIQLRIEAYNGFNHTNFANHGNPDNDRPKRRSSECPRYQRVEFAPIIKIYVSQAFRAGKRHLKSWIDKSSRNER